MSLQKKIQGFFKPLFVGSIIRRAIPQSRNFQASIVRSPLPNVVLLTSPKSEIFCKVWKTMWESNVHIDLV